MNTYRKNAVMTGVLYFLGTVFGVSGALIGGEVLTSFVSGKPLVGVDILGLVAANSSQLTIGALFNLLMGISLVAMTVFLYPVLRKASKELAMGMVLFRGALEGVFYFLSTLTILTLVVVGNEYIATGADSAVLQSMGNLLYQFENLKGPASSIIFLIGAMCIYIPFYRTRLIPRWISVWGFIAVVATIGFRAFEYLSCGYRHWVLFGNGDVPSGISNGGLAYRQGIQSHRNCCPVCENRIAH